MNDISITSEPAQPPAKSTAPKTKKRKMNAAQRKALSVAAKARWAAKTDSRNGLDEVKSEANKSVPFYSPTSVPLAPPPPSPAVLALQTQVVELVNQRNNSRQRLTETHTAYLMAQGAFQAMQSELQGIEQEVQYRIQLIAQLENRTPSNVVNITGSAWIPETVNQANFGGMTGVSSEPSAPVQRQPGSNLPYATGSADDLRREMRGMM